MSQDNPSIATQQAYMVRDESFWTVQPDQPVTYDFSPQGPSTSTPKDSVRAKRIPVVYLLCFSSPIGSVKHSARHYLGWSECLDARLKYHQQGSGARITRAAILQGIQLSCVRIWQGASRKDERLLKNQKRHARLCPNCRDANRLREQASRRTT